MVGVQSPIPATFRAVLILVNGQVNESTVCPLQRTASNTLRRFLCKKLTSLLCSVGEFEGFYRKPSNNHRTRSVCSMAKSMVVTRWDDARTEKAEVEPRYNVSRVYKFEPSTVYDRYCIYQSREKTRWVDDLWYVSLSCYLCTARRFTISFFGDRARASLRVRVSSPYYYHSRVIPGRKMPELHSNNLL